MTVRVLWLACVAILLTIGFNARVRAQEPTVLRGGRNVNMAGGEQSLGLNPFRVRGDVLGRAQNEPSCAFSTRNPKNVLCGANDYRMVDVPGVTTTQITRDAWLGEFQSGDGGETWESTLHRGFYLDPEPHPLKFQQFRAAADPTIRSGPAGLAFYSGIAFRQDRSRNSVFVTTYADLNNREHDPMPFKFVRTVIVDLEGNGRFIDKPWMYVEAAPPGDMCTIVVRSDDDGGTPLWASKWWGRLVTRWLQRHWPNWVPRNVIVQRVPGSIVHLVYTVFLDDSDTTAQLMYSRSDNCGLTFSRPRQINRGSEPSNGAAIAKPLNTTSRRVFTAWRRVQTTASPASNAIVGATSDDDGRSWNAPVVIAEICPFDQGTTSVSFRTTAFPTMTADATGRAYVAWSDRGRLATGECDPFGAARIRIATSVNGRQWTVSTASPSETPEHQIQPSLVFTTGQLAMAWIDFTDDASRVFGRFIDEREVVPSPGIRHTADIRAAMAWPGVAPAFGEPTRISEYLRGVGFVNGQRVATQLQWNPVNRRWARRGTVPFDGDYIDIATLPYLPPDPGTRQTAWRPNNQATLNTPLGPAPRIPTLLIAWTDNRDMRSAPNVDIPPGHDPSNPLSPQPQPVPYVTPTGLSLPPTSIADPTQMRVECTGIGDVYKTGTTNQNAYTARATVGVLAGSPGNNKPLGAVQRSFVIFVRNDTTASKTFRLVATQPAGGIASFDQFDPLRTVLDIFVPARTSVARTVFVSRDRNSTTPLDPDASIRVDVIETAAGVPVQASSVFLNADPSAPEIDSPEIDSREIFAPEIDSPEIDSPEIDSHGFTAPEIDSPEIDSPEIDSQTILSLGLQTPEIDSPEIDSPEIDSPEIDSPEIDSPEIDSSAITDLTFRVTNSGNTTGQYNAKALVRSQLGTNYRYQVIVRRKYELPAVGNNCLPTTMTLSKVAVNIKDVNPASPEIDSPEIDSPEIDSAAIDTASFFVAPGETVDMVVRVRSATIPTPAELTNLTQAVAVAVQQEAVDSDDAAQGITEPPVITSYLSIGTQALRAGLTGVGYAEELVASGGTAPYTWSVIAGALPPGLGLTGGAISGTPTANGTFTFTLQVADAAVPVQTATRTMALTVSTPGVASLAFVTQPSNTVVGDTITPAVSVRAVDTTGAAVPGIPVTLTLIGTGTLSGVVTRQTGATGVAVFTGLSLGTQATGLQLLATASGFASATSTTFNGVLPDLVVSSFTHSPANPTPADTITFTAVVTNIGAGSAGASTLMFDIGGEISGAPSTMFPIPALAPGASFTVQRQQSLPAGAFLNAAVADYTSQVTESNEGNNTASDSYSVVAPNAALAFSVQPTTTAVGQVMPPITVLATNAAAQPIAGVAVTLGLIGTGTLSGTTTKTTGPTGLAVFNDLSVDTLGAGKSLQATATNFPAVTSTTFDTVTNIGQIAGTVTSSVSGPLAGATVQIADRFGAVVTFATTLANGAYLTPSLPSGTYYARTNGIAGHLNITYGCPNVSCQVLVGTPITIVGGGAIVGGIDFNLTALGGISGTVVTNTGAPRATSSMSAVNVDNIATSLAVAATTTSAADGTYTLSLAPGRYYVRSSGNGLIPRIHGGLNCVGCLITDGVAVTVTAGVITTGINFVHQPGGQISGTVTNAVTGAPLNGVSVQIFTATGELVGGFNTNASGAYFTAGLSDGQYFVKTVNTLGFIDELYGNFPCALGCAVTTGTPVTISNGVTATGVNLALAPSGRITGTVTDALTSAPLSGVAVLIYRSNGQLLFSVNTNASGVYTSPAVPNGTYFVRVNGPTGYIDELYNDETCVLGPPACDVTAGTPVVISGGVDATGIDFGLSRGGFISGRLTNELTGAPLAGVPQTGFSGLATIVGIFNSNGVLIANPGTDQDGRYITNRGLPAGQYYAKTFTRGVTIDEVYGGESCLGDVCNVLSGTPITVTNGAITPGVDFALAVGGTINATVVTSTTGLPIASSMSLFTSTGQLISTSVLPTAGVSAGRGLPPGNYFARTADIGSTLLQPYSISGSVVHEVYNNTACLPGCDVTAGTPIAVTANTTVPITFALDRALGRITGYVTDAATGQLLSGVAVEIYSASGTLVTTVTSRSTGEGYFASSGLIAGTYYLRTRNTFGYRDVLYSGIACVGECNVTLGTPVIVQDGQPTTGIVLALPLSTATEPLVTISSADDDAAETGPNPGSFTVSRTGDTSSPLVVNYTVSGTATSGSDYTALAGSITIPAGDASATFPLNVIDDAVFEPAETIIVTLTADEGYDIAAPGQAFVTIAGDSGDSLLVVRNTNDSGPGSLRQALLDANLAPDSNAIRFDIPGAGPHTIQPLTALPTVTSPIVLDATTQPGFADTPLVELSGASAGVSTGLDLRGGNSTVRGLVINRWMLSGIALLSPTNVGNNVIAGNYIGTDVAGSGGAPSTLEQTTNAYTHNPTANRVGVLVASPNARIGGTTLADRNLISGNSEWGLAITVFTAADGVTVLSSGANTVVQGNYFGTDVTGSVAKPNGAVRTNGGVPNALITGSILVNVPNVTIGGVAAGAGNVISANAIGIAASPRFEPGTFALISNGSSLTVQGNLIGMNAAGTLALPFNTNLNALAAASRGTGIQISSPDAVIGGSAAGAANVISGNASYGINAGPNVQNGGSGGVLVSSASNLTVQGNRIGTNLAGTAAIPGSGAVAGITLLAPNGHIGGTAAGAGNIISGNGGIGIQLVSVAFPPVVVTAANALIEANWIGLAGNGTSPLGNGADGINVNSVASVTIRANIISGNLGNGIQMVNSASTNGSIRGNWIGLASNGTAAVANIGNGVLITSNANGNTVGGTNAGDGNVIAGNLTRGLVINSNASGNIVRGNFIGTNVSGTAALPNTLGGIQFDTGATNNTIGGTTPAARNVISGNGSRGIELTAAAGLGNQITGNFIGTNPAGTAALANALSGVFIGNSNTTVGGTTPGAGNLISGNGDLSTIQAGFGIQISGGGSNVVQGNFIGTNATGTAALGNKSRGIDISNSTNNTIGGTTAAARNIISGNGTAGGGAGVGVFGANNTIQGNYIGTDVTGVFPIPNTFGGVLVRGANTVVGGTAPGAGNRIAFNTNAAGVSVLDDGANSPILSNRIFSNGGLGIDLAVGVATNGVTVNDAGDGDIGPNDLQNFPVITSATTTTMSGTLNSTPNTTFTIQLFVSVTCDPSGFGEGDTPITTFNITTDGAGLGNFAQGGLALTNGHIVSATATNPAGSTSEFSACATVVGP